MSRTITVVAAHPDDEVLGCAGTIAHHVAAGHSVHAIFMSGGVGSRKEDIQSATTERSAAMEMSRKILGLASTQCLDFPDNAMDSIPRLRLIQSLEAVLEGLRPDTVYTHHGSDLNIDHRLTYESVLTACRPLPGSVTREILCFETVSSTEWQAPCDNSFSPNVFVDITDHMDTKLRAIDAYAAEMRPPPHARSVQNIEALARYRGHTVGCEYAEAFYLVRRILSGR